MRARGHCWRCCRFNPRAHAGRDGTITNWLLECRGFNPRAHAGRDPILLLGEELLPQFQSTRPRGARLIDYEHQTFLAEFQSTRPRGARPSGGTRCRGRRTSFNPRAHAGRDKTPTKCSPKSKTFQSTRPRGARPGSVQQLREAGEVSIHAPTRGATRRAGRRACCRTAFQSTRPRGARPAPRRRKPPACCRFQSTRPRGARRRTTCLPSCTRPCFNPRAHAGRDCWTRPVFTRLRQFQSTRPRGARHHHSPVGQPGESVSIHAPTRGATLRRPRGAFSRRGFNPRAHAGRDAAHRFQRPLVRLFQSTRPRGARRAPAASAESVGAVSIHAPTRGATGSPRVNCAADQGFNPRAHAGRDATWCATRARATCFNPRAHAGRDRADAIAG